MLEFLLKRLAGTALVLVGVTLIVFFLTRLSGDPAALFMPEDATRAQIEAFRVEMGWDQPVPVQFARFLSQAVRGDFGRSLRHGEPALQTVLDRVPATAQLAGLAFAVALLIAVPLGVASGLYRNSFIDAVARTISMLGVCIPNFWLGVILIMLFAVTWQVLPAFGRGGVQHLILPAITLGFSAAATIARLLRSSVIDVVNMDHVRTARSKGLGFMPTVVKHVLRNASIPVVTIIALQIGYFLSGSVVVETVFAYPGVGRLAIQSILNRDYAVVQVFVLLAALLFATLNVLVDLTYSILDPRIRIS
ncbi:MAG: ABC transporter permease [Trueperaceae bacterium]|nr:ABC transporter permease [Trueperaceae bacterium]